MSFDDDPRVLEAEADLLDAFHSLQTNVDSYVNHIHLLEFTPENSYNINRYIHGLKSLHSAFTSLIEVTEIIASLKGIHVDN